MISKFWKDEAGSFVFEYLLVATLVSLATIVGLNSLGAALNSELIELANAITSISQSYSYTGFSTCKSSVSGSQAQDVNSSITLGFPAATPQSINVLVCN